MNRRSLEGEWQRRKEYLHPFIEQPVLSPIPEHRESTASPHQAIARLEAYSPLPDLTIEKRPRYYYEDETEEFYNRLEIKMKRLYRKIFLGEDIDIEDVSDNSVPDARRGVEDEGAAKHYLEDDVSANGVPGDIEDMEEIVEDDGAAIDLLKDDFSDNDVPDGSEGIEDDGAEMDIPVDDDDSSEPMESAEEAGSESNLARSEPSKTTSEYDDRFKTTQENLAEMGGRIFSLSSSEERVSEIEENILILPSQTYTEKPDQSEESSSAKSLQSDSESSEAIVETQTVHAMIHSEAKDAEEEEHQLEVMRRQETHSLEDSYVHSEYSKDERLDLNIEHSMEESPINTVDSRKRSVPVEYELSLPSKSPLKEISPVLRVHWKRPATTKLFNVAAKNRKMNNKENFRDVATEIEINSSSKEIQVDISIPISSMNAEIQTDFQEKKDADTETCLKQVDAGIQTDEDSVWVQCRNTATQTDSTERETNDQGTQTRRSFEFYRFLDGVNFFFIF